MQISRLRDGSAIGRTDKDFSKSARRPSEPLGLWVGDDASGQNSHPSSEGETRFLKSRADDKTKAGSFCDQ